MSEPVQAQWAKFTKLNEDGTPAADPVDALVRVHREDGSLVADVTIPDVAGLEGLVITSLPSGAIDLTPKEGHEETATGCAAGAGGPARPARDAERPQPPASPAAGQSHAGMNERQELIEEIAGAISDTHRDNGDLPMPEHVWQEYMADAETAVGVIEAKFLRPMRHPQTTEQEDQALLMKGLAAAWDEGHECCEAGYLCRNTSPYCEALRAAEEGQHG